ncbi:MAG: type II secretion system protein GspC [Pseudomonadota bacterium]
MISTNKKHAPANLPTTMTGKIMLSVIIALLLVLAITFRVGMAGKALTEENAAVAPSVDLGENNTTRSDVDLARVQALNLFGAAPISGAPSSQSVAINASQTSLNLRLEGVVLAIDANRSAAIIVVGGKQATFRVGETLPVGNQVKLASVHNDHVIIDNDGATESLWLYDGKTDAPGTQGSPAASVVSGTTTDVINRLRAQRANAPAVAATLGEIIQVAPAQANGELLGYRLSPGVKLKEFVQLGFQQNDIVTSVNGIALNDMRNLPQLYSLMNEATEVSFSLLRNGQPQTLQISLTGTP